MKKPGVNLSIYYCVKEPNLYIVWFQLYDLLEKQNSGDNKRSVVVRD